MPDSRPGHPGIVALAVASACTIALDPPPGSKIRCAATGDCPAEHICNPTTGLCIPAATPDTVAPTLERFELSPAAARSGTTVTASVTFSEAVQAPRLFFHDGGVRYDFSQQLHEGADAVFVFRPDVTLEGTFALQLSAHDDNQNPYTGPTGVALVVDQSPPATAGIAISVALPDPTPVATADAFLGEDRRLTTRIAPAGSTVSVVFATSEPLDPASGQVMVTAEGAGISMPLAEATSTGSTLRFTLDVDGATTEQTYDVAVTLSDAAGHSVTEREMAAFTIDRTPPTEPDVSGDILYRRVPFGADATAGFAEFTVRGAPAVVEPGAYLFVYPGPQATQGAIAVGRVAPDGGFAPLLLPAADRPTVFMSAVDPAGNASPRVAVDRVEWVATLGGKIAGSPLENPNVLLGRPAFGGTAIAGLEASAADDVHVVSCAPGCGQSTFTTEGAGGWLADLPAVFAPYDDSATAFDPARQRVVMFGGTSSFLQRDETWQWDGARWRRHLPATLSPPPREDHAMVFDHNLGQIVMFGGWNASGTCDGNGVDCNDAWAFDGYDWQKLSPAGTAPAPRSRLAMAFDASRGVTLIYGGSDFLTWFDDTLALDCSVPGCAWSAVANTTPAGRTEAAMIFDPVSGTAVLHGGRLNPTTCIGLPCEGNPESGLFTLGGSAWTEVSATTRWYRDDHRLIFDPARREILGLGVPASFAFQDDRSVCGRPWSFDGDDFSCPPHTELGGVRDVPELTDRHVHRLGTTGDIVVMGTADGTRIRRWDGGAAGRPAHVFSAAVGHAIGGQSNLVARINFQPPSAPPLPGYLIDSGAFHGDRGNGYAYGWIEQGACATFGPPAGFDNNDPNAPDQAHDTYLSMLLPDQSMPTCDWQLSLPDGAYIVRVVAGDSLQPAIPTYLTVEGAVVIDGRGDASQPWHDVTVRTDVADGALTLGTTAQVGLEQSHLSFLEVFVATPIESIDVRWRGGASSRAFQPEVRGRVYRSFADTFTGAPVTLHSSDTPAYPADESLDRWVGIDPNVTWEITVYATLQSVLVDPPTQLSQWCLTFDQAMGSPHCTAPAASIEKGRGFHGQMDLSAAGLSTVGGLELSFTLDGTLNDGLEVYLWSGAREAGTDAHVELHALQPGGWTLVAAGPGTPAAPVDLAWTSAASGLDPSLLLSGESRVATFALTPRGSNGFHPSVARVATDYVEVTVRYRRSVVP